MTSKHAGSVLALMAIAGTLGACGSSSSSSKTIPKAQFIARADSICLNGQLRTNAIPAPKSNPATATKAQLPRWATFFAALAASLQTDHTALAALPKPDSGATQITQALADLQLYITQLSALGKRAAAGDLPGFQALFAQLNSPSSSAAKASQLAKQFGLKVCGGSGR
jgi:hypothetical protein